MDSGSFAVTETDLAVAVGAVTVCAETDAGGLDRSKMLYSKGADVKLGEGSSKSSSSIICTGIEINEQGVQDHAKTNYAEPAKLFAGR